MLTIQGTQRNHVGHHSKVEVMMKKGQDVEGYLTNEIDFDIVSPKVIDLDVFRGREGLPNITTARWVKFLHVLGENNISDRAASSAIDKTISNYKKIPKRQN